MEKFLEYAEKLTQPDKLVFGFGGTVSGDGNIGGITGGTYFGQGPWDDKTQKAQMDQPGAIQGLQFFKDLRDKYKVQPNSDQGKVDWRERQHLHQRQDWDAGHLWLHSQANVPLGHWGTAPYREPERLRSSARPGPASHEDCSLGTDLDTA